MDTQYLHSKEFNNKYYYDGKLGAIYSTESTTFRVWAPTAIIVELIDYTDNTIINMQKYDRGVWERTLFGDKRGMQYRFRLHFADGKIEDAIDPYAYALTTNSERAVVIDIANTNPDGWISKRMPPFESIVDAIIYEAHIRDLTIGLNNGIKNKGKFLGLAETGTKTSNGNPSGIDYIASLGITHIQLMPIYDFATIDESQNLGYNQQYNWGYDPLNFNVPEGSYCTDTDNPENRTLELKQLINELHKHGIRVIMDVAYNHVFNTKNTTIANNSRLFKSALERTVPGYYFRMKNDGSFYDGTFCGNETASEQAMMRKYIVDSVCFWAKEYNIDGFRFDLMGIHDIDTIRAIRKALDSIDTSIIMLGEAWNMGNHPKGVLGANQQNIKYVDRVAVFNDWYRNTIKGNNDLSTKGFINNGDNIDNTWSLLNNIKGMQHNNRYTFASPEQSVIYNEAHDNYTLYDHLLKSGVALNEVIQRHALATATQYMSNGAIFIHAGQETLRTKQGDHNSYSSPDSINELDYDRVSMYTENFEFFKKLNVFRKKYGFMRMRCYKNINESYIHNYKADANTVDINKLGYKITNAFALNNQAINAYIFFNSSTSKWIAPLESGEYNIMIKGLQVYDTFVPMHSNGHITVPALSMLLICNAI